MSPKKTSFWIVVTALLLALNLVYLALPRTTSGEFSRTDAAGQEERVVVIPSSKVSLPKCLVEDSYFHSVVDHGWVSYCDEFVKNPPLQELHDIERVLEDYKGTLEAIEIWGNTAGDDGRVAMSLTVATVLFGMGYNLEQVSEGMGIAYPVNEIGMLGQTAIVLHFPDENHGVFYHLRFKSNAGLANFLNDLRMEGTKWMQ